MNALRYPNAHLSTKQARVALSMLLSGCTLERLRAFTVADLAATYNVSAAVVGKMLAAAREGRGL
jgi:DNA-binding IscR family transcriptional regulator